MSQLLLLSGGIDSIAIAWWLRPTHAITVNYGQRGADAEYRAASAVANRLSIQHELIDIPLGHLGSGSMAESDTRQSVTREDNPNEVPPESWPYRNQLLITVGAMAASKTGCTDVVIGTVKTDSRHQDGQAWFVNQFSEIIAKQEAGIGLHAPAIDLESAELVIKTNVPASVLGWAHSCHVSSGACGRCSGCIKYQEVMDSIT